jgi:Cu/Ag efflux pump CusA
VPLRELADVFLSTGRAAVLREGLRRYVEVSCRVEGRDLHSFVREAEATIRGKMRFPPDVKLAFAGAAAGRALPPPEALSGCVLAGGAIVLLIALALGRPRSVVLVLAVLPFALAGGALAILLAGGKVSPGSLVGFVGIFGITIRHALIVFKTVERLETPAGRPMDLETLRRAPAELFPSFLGIAAAVGLTLLPLAIRGVEPGAEIAAPMAAVLVGGLLTSTVLLGLVLPSLALRHGAFGDRVR